ncbi:MAG TPA: hypothetical protein VGN16_02170 [Acidobacteriaceae bacterium]|jgi:hypothetical protein
MLKSLGYDPAGSAGSYTFKAGPGQSLREADFIGADPRTGKPLIAEFKLTLSGRARPSFIGNAIAQLKALNALRPRSALLLIITCPLEEHWKASASESGVDYIWDLPELLSQARSTPLYSEFLRFLEEAGVPDVRRSEPALLKEADLPIEEIAVGEAICKKIESIGFEKGDWRLYEDLCTDALRHLFGDQFGKVYPQAPSEGNMHRRDLLVRLDPTHHFWQALSHDFRCRYVIFEFKNYQDEIGQDQIYSTEKYLLTAALRSVCFIIVRSGADDNAYRAAAGALREAGKLIVIVTGVQLCRMLEAKDRGEEPEILLNELVDDLLVKMLR